MTSKTRSILLRGFVFCLMWLSLGSAVPPDSTDSKEDDIYYVIETRHRLYPKFMQLDTVSTDEPFYIGEEEYEARVIAFNPHLGITTEGEILQMSDTLYNPAARIKVTHAGENLQESWAFHLVRVPHYNREDMLGFRLLSFEAGDGYADAPGKE